LPVISDPLKARDGLVAGDILRSVKIALLPRADIYQGLIEALKDRGGYHEETWINPSPQGDRNAIYTFAYDWRLDNVQNARVLIQNIRALQRRLKRPDLKFDVIAHSMGGLITRYAAMYGDADIPPTGRAPSWAGAVYFNKIALLGTPNEGSPLTLAGFVHGESFGPIDINLPFVRNISRFDVFTIPAAYELLPAPGTFKLVGPDLKPIEVDLYDPKVWSTYGWNPIDDRKFAKEFTPAEQRAARSFFTKMLARAKRFQEALNATGNERSLPVTFELIGSQCKDTVGSALVRRDKKTNDWLTLFKPEDFSRLDGQKVPSDAVKGAIYFPGDGVVTVNSFAPSASWLAKTTSPDFVCEGHNRLAANPEVQDHLIALFAKR
jgi:pimeloyl-ACP methyl ester carboxylesterase